jgi:outer membrane receptor protein involved in Fe transport
MYDKKRLSLAVSAALGLASFLTVPGQVMAQSQDQADEEGDMLLEEVVVTGSRLISEDGFGRTSPVTVVGMEAIASTGLTRMEDVLNSLPSVQADETGYDANGATGTGTIDLRGLGTNRTVVLINGRRMQGGGVYTEAPDVNQIPAAMVERVEVLTGGASATYGADAVAGVVNFIMRRVDGVEFSAGWSGYQHDNDNSYIQGLMDARGFDYPTGSSGIDGEAYNFDLVAGGDFADGRGNATAYISFRKNQELRQGARDYSSCALSNSGTSCGGSSTTPVPHFDIYPLDADGNLVGGGWFSELLPDGSVVDDTGTRYNFAPINHFMRPDERWSMGAFLDFEINDHAVPYMEFMYLKDKTKSQIAESGTFYFEPYPISLDNELLTDQFRASLQQEYPGEDLFGIFIGKRNVEGGPRADNLDHSSFRVVAGVKGVITGNWDYDAYYLHGETTSSTTYKNDLLAPKLAAAVQPDVCAVTTGCIPYEVFTYQGVTPEQAAALGGTAVTNGFTSLDIFSAYATGNLGFGLPAGDIAMVGGYQYLKTKFVQDPDELYEQGSLLGQGGPFLALSGGYSVDELFAEASVPLLEGLPFIDRLTLDLAYRWSDYSTGFSTDTYRFGFDWGITDSVRFRAGYNRAVRAPSVGELFSNAGLGLWSGTDPCSTATPEYTQEQCARTGMTAEQYGIVTQSPAGQYNGIFGGNVNLQPEKADTYTAGIVWDVIDGMSVSVDYWDIEIEDVISNIDPEFIIRQCAEEGTLCEFINRSQSGSLWLGQTGYVSSTQENLGSQHWEGVDLAWNYTVDGLGGTWNFNVIGTYMLTKEETPIPGDATSTYDCVGIINTTCDLVPTPEWRHVASATYDSNTFWAVTARWRYFDDVFYDGTTDLIANDEIKDFSYLDLSGVIRFMDTHDVTFGVNNVFDETPPLVGGTLSGGDNNANTLRIYDPLGRYLFANVTLRW